MALPSEKRFFARIVRVIYILQSIRQIALWTHFFVPENEHKIVGKTERIFKWNGVTFSWPSFCYFVTVTEFNQMKGFFSTKQLHIICLSLLLGFFKKQINTSATEMVQKRASYLPKWRPSSTGRTPRPSSSSAASAFDQLGSAKS